jgi:hypothetical protein
MTGQNHISTLILTAASALSVLCAPAWAFTVYTSLPSWQAALTSPAITTDSFSTTIPSAQSIVLDSGTTSTNSGPAVLPNAFNNNSVGVVNVGFYDNAVQAGSGSASNTINWVFPTPMVAFAADFLRTDAGRLSLAGDFDGTGLQTLLVNDTMGAADGFLGVIGTVPFSSVTFGNPETTVESFSIDNAYFAPVPGPLPVLGATAALSWSRRLRRRLALQDRQSVADGSSSQR